MITRKKRVGWISLLCFTIKTNFPYKFTEILDFTQSQLGEFHSIANYKTFNYKYKYCKEVYKQLNLEKNNSSPFPRLSSNFPVFLSYITFHPSAFFDETMEDAEGRSQ